MATDQTRPAEDKASTETPAGAEDTHAAPATDIRPRTPTEPKPHGRAIPAEAGDPMPMDGRVNEDAPPKPWTDPLVAVGMPSSSGAIADGDPPETNDWRDQYLGGEEIALTDETAPKWLREYLAAKQLPIESMVSRGCHLMRFAGRKTVALIIPSVVLGEMAGLQKWYDPFAPWRSEEDKHQNPKNRWTVKDPDAAILNVGQIHSHASDAPVVLLESPPDAATVDTIIVTGEDEHDPCVHRVAACCGVSNLPKAAAMLNVEFPGRPLVIIAQSEADPKNHEKLAKLAQKAVKWHPRATLHHCPDRSEDGQRVGNDISDMFVRGEIPSWRALCEAVEPPIGDDSDSERTRRSCKGCSEPPKIKGGWCSSECRAANSIYPDWDVVIAAMADDEWEIRYNIRAARWEHRPPDSPEWKALVNQSRTAARKKAASLDEWEPPITTGVWDDILDMLAFHRETDPFREWLDALPDWDGTEKIKSLLSRLWTLDPDPRNLRLASQSVLTLLLGAVTRCHNPGAPVQEVPVWVSEEQGYGKSLTCQLLLPDHLREA